MASGGVRRALVGDADRANGVRGLITAVGALGCIACGSPTAGGPRFANVPIVWAVDDRHDVPLPPTKTEYYATQFAVESTTLEPVFYWLSIPRSRRAQNVNALGGVPDSTWFYNRVGRREMTAGDIARGPGTAPLPSDDGPLIILEGKPSGVAPGFIVEDAAGTRFLVKFDNAKAPEMETGAEVVAQRLLWAVGYHVPQDEVGFVRRDQFVIGPEATMKTKRGEDVPMTEQFVQTQFSRGVRGPDGRYRVQISKFLPGVPVGGYPGKGVRKDDPNDRIPHEHRRDLRGQYVFFSWLGHSDVKTDNSLDMWVEAPSDPSRHFLMHYLLDFGRALGVQAAAAGDPEDTYITYIDYLDAFPALFAFGIWSRPWEHPPPRTPPGIGWFDVEHYRPELFEARRPYAPFREFDRFDGLWAIEILLSLEREHIEAAVAQGRYTHRAAAQYLVATLIGRQRKAARAFLDEDVLPLVDFEVRTKDDRTSLCMRDLWLAHRLGADAAPREHRATVHDYWGNPYSVDRALEFDPSGRACLDGIVPAPIRGGYTMVSVDARRGDDGLPPVWVHLAPEPRGGRLRIIGLHRM